MFALEFVPKSPIPVTVLPAGYTRLFALCLRTHVPNVRGNSLTPILFVLFVCCTLFCDNLDCATPGGSCWCALFVRFEPGISTGTVVHVDGGFWRSSYVGDDARDRNARVYALRVGDKGSD